MLGMAVINAIIFGVQGNLMKTREDTILNQSFTGSVAGICQSFICSPMELIKLRMQLQTDRTENFKRSFSLKEGRRVYLNPWDAVNKIVRRDGMRGLYKGLKLTLTREAMSFAIYFGTYEYICRLYVNCQGGEGSDGAAKDHLPLHVLCVAGGTAGIMSWGINYPVDVIKSRMQVDGMFGEKRYRNILNCLSKTVKEPEGMWTLSKGLASTLVRGFVVNAVTLPTVSLILRYWRRD